MISTIINKFIIDKILEPLKYAAELFNIWGKIAGFLENIGLPMWISMIVSIILSILIIGTIILIPGIIIKWIINKIKEL